jgi:hypothetical protein
MCFQWEEEEEKHRMRPKRTVSQIHLDTGPKFFARPYILYIDVLWFFMFPLLSYLLSYFLPILNNGLSHTFSVF